MMKRLLIILYCLSCLSCASMTNIKATVEDPEGKTWTIQGPSQAIIKLKKGDTEVMVDSKKRYRGYGGQQKRGFLARYFKIFTRQA